MPPWRSSRRSPPRSGPRSCGSTRSASAPSSAPRSAPSCCWASSAGSSPAGVVWSSLWYGYRARPIYAPTTPQQDALDRYREALEPVRRIGTIVIPILVGILTGFAAAQQWETFLLWRNGTQFGTTDPQFGLDIGFFVFTLPWLSFVVGFLSMVLIFGAIAAAFTHYVYGGLQFQNRGRDTTRAALLHLSTILAALVLVRAAAYWLERYSLSLQTSDLMTGIQYTDANAVLPVKAILAIAAVIVALMFISVIWTHSWRLPVVGIVLLLVVAIVIGGIYPALIQSLRVKPSEKSLETPFLARNITATRAAYGLDKIEVRSRPAQRRSQPGPAAHDGRRDPWHPHSSTRTSSRRR